jgi:hypothetical protein
MNFRDESRRQHDLSYAAFYHKSGYSLICPRGGIDCKDIVYTPPQGEKAAIAGGGIYLKYAADFLMGGRFAPAHRGGG